MKKSYQKLFIFDVILFFIFFVNSFVLNILNNYYMILFLLFVIICFKFIFGVERDRHRYVKDVIFDIFILLLIFFILYYLFGVLIGFYRVENYYNWYGIKNFIIPLIFTIILKEYLRYQMITKSEGSKLLFVVTVILFIFLDISGAIYYGSFSTSYDIFIFVALTLLPSISRNIVCSYIAIKLGYKPNIVWLLIIQLYTYLIPIVPNSNEYIMSIIQFLLPFVILWKVYSFFIQVKDSDTDRNYKKQSKTIFLIPTFLTIVIVYLTSGYFHYYVVAIASGSMSPEIRKGDVVIIEKLDEKYDQLKVGQVLSYQYHGVLVVHRIVEIIEDQGEYYFYTQGDANDVRDNYVIHEDMIVGIVNYKIPYVGLPTVWLNDL